MFQAVLEKKINVTRATVYYWLRGGQPRGKTLDKLAAALGTTPNTLLSNEIAKATDSKGALSKLLIEHLKVNGISREEFADLIKTSRMSVYNWIEGLAKPTPYSERKIARGLNIPVSMLRDKLSKQTEEPEGYRANEL